MLPLEARSAHCPPPVADGMSVPRSKRGELHTAFTQSSIVPISRPLVELFTPDGANPCGEDAGDEHPANTPMAKTAANPSTLFICTAPRVRLGGKRLLIFAPVGFCRPRYSVVTGRPRWGSRPPSHRP